MIDTVDKQKKEALGRLWRCFDFNKSELAKACGVDRNTVYRWFSRGYISATCAIRIESHPNVAGNVTKEELRPDVQEWFGQ